MKRRVLNAAANKKALRQCSAMTGARAPFRVLCDASFLRVSFDYFRHYRKAGESLTRRELEATLPSLENLFSELFGTSQFFLQTTPESQEDFLATYHKSQSNTGAKKNKMQQELEAKLLGGELDATRETATQKDSKRHQHVPNEKQAAEANTFLRKFEVVGKLSESTVDQSKKERRNEHKAIIAVLKDVASGKNDSGYHHPLSSYFVATLNHDMKSMLRRGDADGGHVPIPTIRMTFNPWLLWLEAGELKSQKSANEVETQEQSAEKPKFKGVTSKADRAFLGHLVKESTTLADTVAAREKFLKSGFNKKINHNGPRAKIPCVDKKKGPLPNANPLAMKKKRQRETIVCTDDHESETSKKYRSENPKQ